jgi:hypothetical protein
LAFAIVGEILSERTSEGFKRVVVAPHCQEIADRGFAPTSKESLRLSHTNLYIDGSNATLLTPMRRLMQPRSPA